MADQDDHRKAISIDGVTTIDSAPSTRAGSEVTRREVLGTAMTTGLSLAIAPLLEASEAEASTPLPPAPASAGGPVLLKLKVNGETHERLLEPRVTLLDALREHLGLFGTKKGCDHGQCGACTVLVNNERVNSCLTLAIMHQGEEITTIEGIAHDDQLHPVQAAFIAHDAFQCGYCTPGQICSAVGLIHEGHIRSLADIREQMAGNICRCGAYTNIIAAIVEAFQQEVRTHP